jgi:nucleoside-diphosphate-sugar epimerase
MRALVTGGSGFLGGAIVDRLLARGDSVRSLARGDAPELRARGVEIVRADLADRGAVVESAAACDIVYHVAAKAGYWGDLADYERANVLGTQHVLEACREQQVRRLVYTSTPSVIYDGCDIEGADESLPYSERFESPYPETKARAERLVQEANGPELATVSLRPHLIWGPGDNQLTPRLVARARAGTLVRIGSRPCLVDTVYIDNAADAHLNAADRLEPGSRIAGRVYFISNGEPRPCAEMIDGILAAAGLPPMRHTVPTGLARRLGGTAEALHRLLRLPGEPRLTRFLVSQLSTAHWFDISAARRDLGYEPAVSIDEGLERLARSYRHAELERESAA